MPLGVPLFLHDKIKIVLRYARQDKKTPTETVGAKKKKIIGEKLVEINLQAVYMKAWGKSLHTKNQLPLSELSSVGLVPCDNYIIPCPYVLRMKVLC